MAITGKKIVKEFGEKPVIRVLHDLDFEIGDGEFVSISGRSGSGKSTLLYILSTLDHPTFGDLRIDGFDPKSLSPEELHRFRNEKIGFIFQFHYLLPELTALENVLLGPRLTHQHETKRKQALDLLDEFGIADQALKLPSQMSGGQQQRVAIARALIMKPKYIFADEPTGNLDTTSGKKVMDILKKVNETLSTTIVLVTHEPDYAALAQREIFLIDGHISTSPE